MGALMIGQVAGLLCLWGVNGLKRLLGADDALDVFGVHGVGGIVSVSSDGDSMAQPDPETSSTVKPPGDC